MYFALGRLLLPKDDQIESSATRVEFKEKKSGGVRAWMHKTGYISLVFTAWGKPTISPAPSETGGSVDMKKKICLRPPLCLATA
jgi:hypothetical protein